MLSSLHIASHGKSSHDELVQLRKLHKAGMRSSTDKHRAVSQVQVTIQTHCSSLFTPIKDQMITMYDLEPKCKHGFQKLEIWDLNDNSLYHTFAHMKHIKQLCHQCSGQSMYPASWIMGKTLCPVLLIHALCTTVATKLTFWVLSACRSPH